MMWLPSWNVYATEISRDEAGNYILSEADFTELWREYNRLKGREEVYENYILSMDPLVEAILEQNDRLIDHFERMEERAIEQEIKISELSSERHTTIEVVILGVLTLAAGFGLGFVIAQ